MDHVTHRDGADPRPSSPTTATSPGQAGYRQEMARELGWYASFSIAFGFVSIATGIFTAYGSVLNTSGPRGIWAWPIVVVGQLAVALIFGALAARIPISGYAYQWVSRIVGPVWGWIMGWISFAFLGVVVVAVDYTIASTILPELFRYQGTAQNAWFITAVVILLQAVLVAASTRATHRVNNVAVTVQLIGMVSLTVLLFVVGAVTGKLDFGTLFESAPAESAGYYALGDMTHAGPFALAFLLGAFTIVGFESAANLAEETKEPARVIPKAMAQAVLSLGVLGFLFLIAITALAGDPAELAASDTPVATVITAVLGSVVGKMLLVLVVLSIFSCGLVITLSGTRLVWAMSRDERFPGWRALRRVNRRRGTPLNASIFMLVVAQAVLLGFSGSTDALFELFSAATLLPAIIYASTVVMYIAKRRSLPPSQGFTLGRWELPVIVVASVWLGYELLLFRDASFRNPWLYVLLLFAIGAVYFLYLLATRGRAGLSMPEMRDIDRELDESPDAPEASDDGRPAGVGGDR
ncbi:amino acid permease [Streptomyces sp. 3MP-14]|uniref:Amino acid permease n=1 Tax=Streptomyces mimosae TaxID=2586635 RepID=A0A5N6AQM7_9ACTN|nr:MULTISPECIES: amino acid permease [Streptomyces]KAB8170914.1 amino acid permease [Streptomyces mimosae]KAB8179735.1 amino acid permease [Streptomyces sp. 3MP-14]